MGSRMAMRLINAGHELFVHDIVKETTDPHVKAGAKWAASPAEATEQAEMTFASLPGPIQVEEVALGPKGVISAAKPGHIYVDTTTSAPSLIQRIAVKAKEKGVHVIDASITGGMWGAEQGTLQFICGGEEQAIEKARPIIEIMGTIHHMGPSGSGNATKLVNNLIGQAQMHILAEAFALAAKAGLDLKKVYEFLSRADVSSGILTKFYANKAFKGDFEPGFTIDLVYKDQNLISQFGKECGVPLYFNALVVQRVQENRARGNGSKDATGAILLFEDMLGVKIRVQEGGDGNPGVSSNT